MSAAPPPAAIAKAPPGAADPWRNIDTQPNAERLIAALEERGQAPSQRRLRRAFLRFAGVGPGQEVLEVGCGSGVVLRDVAALVGPRGRAVGVDASRTVIDAARSLCAAHPLGRRIALRRAAGERLPFRPGRFDGSLAVTVMLHVASPLTVVREMARVTRPGGFVALQDQDFGTLAVTHPDRALTRHILDGVVDRLYEEPHSGRRLPALLRAAGLERVRLRTDVYQDTELEPYTQTFLERRAELAVTFGLADPAAVRRWLDGFTALARDGAFVMTINYYGAVGIKPARRPR